MGKLGNGQLAMHGQLTCILKLQQAIPSEMGVGYHNSRRLQNQTIINCKGIHKSLPRSIVAIEQGEKIMQQAGQFQLLRLQSPGIAGNELWPGCREDNSRAKWGKRTPVQTGCHPTQTGFQPGGNTSRQRLQAATALLIEGKNKSIKIETKTGWPPEKQLLTLELDTKKAI
jgi:hypothetical protein